MDLTVAPPDLRGTVILINLTLKLTREGLSAHGTLEIQPTYPKPEQPPNPAP